MMISLYYINHPPPRYFLSRLRELLHTYGLVFFPTESSKHLMYKGSRAYFTPKRPLFAPPFLYFNKMFLFILYAISPKNKCHILFNFLKEIFPLTPLRDTHIRVFLLISFPIQFPFYRHVKCTMPEGIFRLVPLFTKASTLK
jgi:hypothetical protein